MISHHRSLARRCLQPAAVLIALLLSAALRAESITIQNTSGVPIVVQASCIVGGKVNRAAPAILAANDATPAIQLPGNKVITIYDAKTPNKVLFQGVIPAGNQDLNLGIVVDPKTGKFVKLEKMAAPGAADKDR